MVARMYRSTGTRPEGIGRLAPVVRVLRKVPRLGVSCLRGRARLDASELGRRRLVGFLIGPVVLVA